MEMMLEVALGVMDMEVDTVADKVTDMVEDRINFTDVTLVEHVFIQNCISILSKSVSLSEHQNEARQCNIVIL